ncbi:DinB family protein [Cytobacillus horneckiae]|uniref:Damage-inducible protein DinB n=1 Tax=Cytobacillus horneckiae TaxID=549687 RepID=A0A2N0ZEN3_9BACI|nr:DinB family protein [Cytobacillus horneckiae]MEC1158420.1 DinB family protein [Cytobacillus horneckiae]MED2937551.1 DinB family protein [Cytobacillus horneckiae]PKG27976.1 damage-inducible protein DinB [Cytobacillus horneckiae]
MEALFHYNWMVRHEWYKWCEDLSEDELLARRTGGVGSILETLFHIIDVEWRWLKEIHGHSCPPEEFEKYNSLEKIRQLDTKYHEEVAPFVKQWNSTMENKVFNDIEAGEIFTWGEVMRHVIAHEIHHIGQLSVWSRELDRKPVTANFIRRGLTEHIN